MKIRAGAVDEGGVVEGIGKSSRSVTRRVPFLYGLWLVVMLIVAGRSWQLQVVYGERFHSQAEGNRVAVEPLVAPRGIIYDRAGEQLLENVASTDAILNPALLPPEEHEAPLVEVLPSLIDITPEEVRATLMMARDTQQVTLLVKALPHETVIALEGELGRLPGVQLVSSSVRRYYHGHALAPVLGYTSLVTSDELAERDTLLLTDSSGKAGVEREYDQALRGRHGASYVEIDADGRPQKEVGKEDSEGGADVHLTIDSELQQFIYDRLAERAANPDPELTSDTVGSGAVVVLDTRSGEVRALVNYPSYEPNAFSQPALRGEVEAALKDERRPLFNRAIAGTYPPGSTIKPLLAAAGLQEGLITPSTTILSTGGISIGPWHFPDWRSGGHGLTTVTKALADSVNTFFYLLAGGDETREGLGVRRITEYLAGFGWGEVTGVDLPGEETGLLPSPEWKEETKGERWYVGDTYHLGIGQGDVLVTPLQLAVAMAAVANGGTLYPPHTVSFYERADETVVKTAVEQKTIPVAAAHLRTVREGMRETVLSGSARSLATMPMALAGKTGTAQVGGSEDTHSWFVSFGPYDTPEIVMVVLLERGGPGDRAAVPFAREIWQWWIENR